MESKEIIFKHVKKVYGKTEVVKDLNLTIHDGERLILLGPSGCGKSTTLRMIAGLEDISSGDLYMNGIRSSLRRSRRCDGISELCALSAHDCAPEHHLRSLRPQDGQGRGRKPVERSA